jgi:hypothetical protein
VQQRLLEQLQGDLEYERAAAAKAAADREAASKGLKDRVQELEVGTGRGYIARTGLNG